MQLVAIAVLALLYPCKMIAVAIAGVAIAIAICNR